MGVAPESPTVGGNCRLTASPHVPLAHMAGTEAETEAETKAEAEDEAEAQAAAEAEAEAETVADTEDGT